MVNLLNILGQAAGINMPSVDPIDEEISVVGRRGGTPPFVPMDNGPRPLGNASHIEEAISAGENVPQRKGLFGVKGTLRDVLGTLGDAFLIQSGNKAMYQPKRQMERESDALGGFTQDPMAAIERLANVNPEAARELYDEYTGNQIKQGTLQSQEAARKSTIETRNQKNLQDFGNYAARLMSQADTPEKQQYAMQILARRAEALGIDLAELGIGDTLTPDQRAILGSGDMTVNQQQQIPLRQQQLGISQQNADTARQNAGTSADRAAVYKGTTKRDDDRADFKSFIDAMKPEKGSKKASRTVPEGFNRPSKTTPKFSEGQTIYKGGKAYIVRNGKAYPKD